MSYLKILNISVLEKERGDAGLREESRERNRRKESFVWWEESGDDDGRGRQAPQHRPVQRRQIRERTHATGIRPSSSNVDETELMKKKSQKIWDMHDDDKTFIHGNFKTYIYF